MLPTLAIHTVTVLISADAIQSIFRLSLLVEMFCAAVQLVFCGPASWLQRRLSCQGPWLSAVRAACVQRPFAHHPLLPGHSASPTHVVRRKVSGVIKLTDVMHAVTPWCTAVNGHKRPVCLMMVSAKTHAYLKTCSAAAVQAMPTLIKSATRNNADACVIHKSWNTAEQTFLVGYKSEYSCAKTKLLCWRI